MELQGCHFEEDHETAKKGKKEILPICVINRLFSSIMSPKRRRIDVGFLESTVE
jgi:hypothetical protein